MVLLLHIEKVCRCEPVTPDILLWQSNVVFSLAYQMLPALAWNLLLVQFASLRLLLFTVMPVITTLLSLVVKKGTRMNHLVQWRRSSSSREDAETMGRRSSANRETGSNIYFQSQTNTMYDRILFAYPISESTMDETIKWEWIMVYARIYPPENTDTRVD